MTKNHDEKNPVPLMTRYFRACLLAFACIILLWLALQLLAQIWGWLLLLTGLAGLIYGASRFVQWRRDRRW